MLSRQRSLKTRITVATLAIFLASLWGLGSYASYMVRQDMERVLGEQQYSTVTVVAAQINTALIERREALEIVAEPVAQALEKNTATLQVLLDARPLLAHLFNGGVLVLGADGTAVAEAPTRTDRIGVNYSHIAAVAKTLKEGDTTISPPLIGPQLHAPVFAITIPLRNAQGTLIGAISGATHLGLPSFLDNVTHSNYGKTGGYLIVARQPRQVVTATDKLRSLEILPAKGVNPWVDRFVGGHEGSCVGVSPLGVEVLASAKGIPAADWYVAAVLPTAEAFAPIYDAQYRVLIATLCLTLVAGALTWWWIKRLLTPMQEATAAIAAMANQTTPLKAIDLSGHDEIASFITSFNQLLATRESREEALRIAAIAFECQEGIIVMNADLHVIRVNRAFSQITGYAAEEAQAAITHFFASSRNPASATPDFWDDIHRLGAWKGEVRFQRKHGEYYTALVTVTAVVDTTGHMSHHVCSFVDNTSGQLLEQQRLANEAAQRNALVREVHHRIKNNLQGITGLLRQYAQKQPEMAAPINQAISQMRSVSVIHGLQGRAEALSVRLCELTSEIAAEIQELWRTPIEVDIPAGWAYRIVEENEAVPMALVLNELILNAVKHSAEKCKMVRITIRATDAPDVARITIFNSGQLAQALPPSHTGQSGLQLIAALLPREGVYIYRSQQGGDVITWIEVGPPVVSREQKHTP